MGAGSPRTGRLRPDLEGSLKEAATHLQGGAEVGSPPLRRPLSGSGGKTARRDPEARLS